MKKIILPFMAVLLLATVSNAQFKQKTPAKTAAMTTTTKPSPVSSGITKTASVTPSKKTVKPNPNKPTAIKRKHKAKKTGKPKKQ